MQNDTRTSVLSFLFVLSGLLGLVYQIVWFKYLSSFLGNTTYAQAIVLATFMGGMAIGASLWGRWADRSRSQVAVYGWLEVAIGLLCALYPLLLEGVRSGFISVLIDLEWTGETPGVILAKSVAGMITLLPPTILMGGTLPVLVRALTRTFNGAGSVIATLYALNSLGAVIGSILGGFFFIRLVGLDATILSAAGMSVVVGVVALLISRGDRPADETPETDTAGHLYSYRQGQVATVVAGLSGAAAMMLEVAWVRMLIPILGSSTYSFTMMLVAFISGITLGGMYIARRIDRGDGLMTWLVGSQAAIALSVSLSLIVYDRLPYVVWHASTYLSRNESTYPVFLVLQFIFSFLWMFVPTFFFGVSLPVAIRIASRSRVTLGRSVGNVYTVNTVGTVVGSLLAGFVLIPLLGLSGTVQASLWVLAAGVVLIMVTEGRAISVRSRIAVSGTAAAGLLLALLWTSNTMVPSLTGVFRLINKNRTPPPSYAQFVSMYAPSDVLFYREGSSATVGVVSSALPEGSERILIINGKSDASSVSDLSTQLLLGHLPALLHERPANALVIGYGSGATVGGLLKHPLKRLDCVEISPEVVEASPYFSDVNGDPFSDDRFRLYIDDAASFIDVSPTSYDIIVSEPSNPWIAGIGSLYTVEFFERCRERMGPDGIMSQWFHMYEIDDETFQLVVRTFASVFPHVTLWQSMSADVVLIGSSKPLGISEEKLRDRLADPAVSSSLRSIGVEDGLTLLSLQMVSNLNVRTYSGDGLLNTEDHPILEFLAPRAFFVNSGVSNMDDHDERLLHASPDTYLMRRARTEPLTDREKRTIGMYHAYPQRGHPFLGFFLLSDYITRNSRDEEALRTLVDLSGRIDKQEERVGYLRTLADLSPRDPRLQAEYGWARFELRLRSGSALDQTTTAESEERVRRAISLVTDTVDTYRARLADMYFATGRFTLAMDQYARAIQLRESHPRDPYIASDKLFTRLAQCLYYTGDRTRALGYALQAATMNPANHEARDLIVTLWNEGTGTPQEQTTQ